MKSRKDPLNTKRSTARNTLLKKDVSARVMHPAEPLLSAEEVMLSQELIMKMSGKPHEPEQPVDQPMEDLTSRSSAAARPKKTKIQHKRIWAEPAAKKEEQKTEPDSVEAWIKRLQVESEKEENEGAFVYFQQADPADPYSLKWCNYKDTKERFYTLSKKGFTSYYHNEATEFLTVVEWIMERELYEQIKSFKFFKLFRLWRAIKSWRHNVISQKRLAVKNILERKLMLTKPNFASLLVQHRSNCRRLESQLLFNVTEPDEVLTLDQFEATQKRHIKEVAGKITEASQKTKEGFMAEITRTLDELKKKIRDSQQQPDEGNETVQRQTVKNPMFAGLVTGPVSHQPESGKLMAIDAVYEHLGFQSNLSYAQRTEVRKECKMFIRFSYLLDFIAKTSLKNMYINSMRVLNQFLEQHNDVKIPKELPLLKIPAEFVAEKTGKPVLSIQVSIKDTPVLDHEIKYELVDAYEKPPIGKIDENNFDPTCHIQLISDYHAAAGEVSPGKVILGVKIKSAYMEQPGKRWLKISPEVEDIADTMKACVSQMLHMVKQYERHSKNENLHPYASVLEEWDEKVADKWEIAEDKHLSCEDILQDEKDFQERDEIVNRHMLRLQENLNSYLVLFDISLLKFWRYSRIPWNLVTDQQLREPVDVLTLLVKQIKSHKEEFGFRIPGKADLGFCKLNLQKIKDKMCSAPSQALKKLNHIMVSIFFLFFLPNRNE